jgi:uncharacterized coiled-coil protein SlyX
MDLEDTVAAQRDYIKELHKDIESLRQRLHDCNEYALKLKYQLDELR